VGLSSALGSREKYRPPSAEESGRRKGTPVEGTRPTTERMARKEGKKRKYNDKVDSFSNTTKQRQSKGGKKQIRAVALKAFKNGTHRGGREKSEKTFREQQSDACFEDRVIKTRWHCAGEQEGKEMRESGRGGAKKGG